MSLREIFQRRVSFAFFKPLIPYAKWLLIVAFVCMAVAVFGPEEIIIVDIELSGLQTAKVSSGILGVIFFLIFLVIPSDDDELMEVYGKILPGTFPRLELSTKKFKIALIPEKAIKFAAIEPDGFFSYRLDSGIMEGNHTLTLYSEGHIIAEALINLEQDKRVIISRGPGKFMVEQIPKGKFTSYLINKYKSYTNWKDLVQAIEELVLYARDRTEIRQELAEGLEGHDENCKVLCALVLGQLGEGIAEDKLNEIKQNYDDVFFQMRAAWNLMQFQNSKREAEEFLMNKMQDEDLDDGPRVVAAIFLSEKGINKQTVIETLIGGGQSKNQILEDPEVREYILRNLSNVTSQDFHDDMSKWNDWWSENKNRFPDS